MKRTPHLHVLLHALLTIALWSASLCRRDCSTVTDVGHVFSVDSLSCVNYTIEFSWHVDLRVANTQLELSCHNGTDTRDFGNEIPEVINTVGDESHHVSLGGEVQCEIAGCYEDQKFYEEWLIPVMNISCHPSVAPVTVIVSTSHLASPTQSLSTTIVTHPTPSSSSVHTSPIQSPGRQKLVLVIGVPLGVFSAVVFLPFIILCLKEANKSKSLQIALHEDEKVDQNFTPIFLDHYKMCGSISTHIDLLDYVEATIDLPIPSDVETDRQSAFPSPSRTSDTPSESGIPCETTNSNIETMIKPSRSSEVVNVAIPEENTTSCNAMSSTYIRVPQSSSTTSDDTCTSTSHMELETHFSILVDSTINEELGGETTELQAVMRDIDDTVVSSSNDQRDNDCSVHLNGSAQGGKDSDMDTQVLTASTDQTNDLGTTQLSRTKLNDLDEDWEIHECEDDEVVRSLIAEKFTADSQTTSGLSGLSSRSYIYSPNSHSTEY